MMKKLVVPLILVGVLFSLLTTATPQVHAASTSTHSQQVAGQVLPNINGANCNASNGRDFLQFQTQYSELCYANRGHITKNIPGVLFICFGRNHGDVWFFGSSTPDQFTWGQCRSYDRAYVTAFKIL